MAKSTLERTLEKKQREAKKQAEKQARQQTANAIVTGQPIVGNLRLMDAASEEIFRIILDQYDGNSDRIVSGEYDLFPSAYHYSLGLEFEKLNMYGVIVSSNISTFNRWQVFLTPQGLTYFEDKEFALSKQEQDETIYSRREIKQYDVFISHARKDKLNYVDELFLAIRQLGIPIFYDSEEISWGDNWKQMILNGTAQSEFALIVISNNFFDREWTERELKEFFRRQNESGQKVVLPLLYNITVDDMKRQYPFLEEIQVLGTINYSKEEIVIRLAKELIKRYKQK